MLIGKSSRAIKCVVATAMPQGSKSLLPGTLRMPIFSTAAENGSGDILKFP
jgi:hypothetical protein